jgi:serine/threonine protein kinase/WD40 repeat protein
VLESCPDDGRLGGAFDSGSPDEELFEHLAGCPECQRRLEALRRGTPHRGVLTDSSEVADLLGFNPDSEPAVANFEILREIRRGGQGVVYEAHDSQSNRRVALKTILASTLGSDTRIARFEREITLIAGLDHSGIVRLYQSGRLENGSLYFAMEYIDGQDLSTYITERGSARSREEVDQRLLLFRNICEAIAHAHSRGIAHRDLKPSNIRIDSQGLPHVLDFGLAKRVDTEVSDELTRSVEFMGTILWATPEQTPWVDAPIDTRTDVYALGHLLYWMLSVEHPYRTDGAMLEILGRIGHEKPKPLPRPLVSLIDGPDLESVIGRALEKHPRDRYPTVVDLAEDCTNLLEGRPVDAQRSGPFRLVIKLARRHPALSAATALLITILCSVCFVQYEYMQAADRSEALGRLASIQPKAKPSSYRADAEREAWSMLLTGALEPLSDPPTGPDGFPGSAGLLDVLRGLYVDMPVLGTVRPVANGGPAFPLDLQGGVGVPHGEPGGAAYITRYQMPYLEGEEFGLGIKPGSRFRADLNEEHLYTVMEEGVFRFELPLQHQAVATKMREGQGRWGKRTLIRPNLGPFHQLISNSFLKALDRGQVVLDSDGPQVQPFSDKLVMVHDTDATKIYSRVGEDWSRVDLDAALKGGESLDRVWTGESFAQWNGDTIPLVNKTVLDCVEEIDVVDKRVYFASSAHVLVAATGGEQGREMALFRGRSTGEAIAMRLLPGGGRKQKSVWGHSASISTALVSPFGGLLLTKGQEGLIRCWDSVRVLDGWLEPMIGEEQGSANVFGVHAISWCNGSIALAGRGESASGKGTVQFLYPSGGPPISIKPTGTRIVGIGPVPGTDVVLLFAPDGGKLMTWDPKETSANWGPLLRPGCPESEQSQRYNFIAFDSSTGRVAAAADNNTVHLLQFSKDSLHLTQDVRIQVKSFNSPEGLDRRIPAVAWRPGINTLAVGLYSGEISWIHDGVAEDPRTFHTGTVRTVAASPDGSWLVAGSDDGSISFWKWRATAPSFSIPDAHSAPVFALAFDQDSRCLASADRAGLIQVWDVSTWPGVDHQLLYRIDAGLTTVLALEWGRGAQSGELYIGGCKKFGPQVWNAEALNEFVAGNFEYWAKELEAEAESSIVREMRTWSEQHKFRKWPLGASGQ